MTSSRILPIAALILGFTTTVAGPVAMASASASASVSVSASVTSTSTSTIVRTSPVRSASGAVTRVPIGAAAPIATRPTAHRVSDPLGKTGRVAASSAYTYSGATSQHWSGYAAAGPHTTVTSSWIQPTVSCTSRGVLAIWAGLDGVSNVAVEQTGTSVDCSNGTPQAFAWWEMFPALPSEYSPAAAPVSPGDVMTSTVTFLGNEQYRLVLADATAEWQVTSVESSPYAANSSAEIIVEAAETSSGPTTPGDFGQVHFTHASIDNASIQGAQPYALVNSAGSVLATPGAYDSSGDFTVYYGTKSAIDMAFQQASSTAMSVETSSGGYSGIGIGLGSGTSPSITAVPAGGFETAFAGPGGQLWVAPAGSGAGPQQIGSSGVAPDTSPSIAALPSGGWEVAYQNTGGMLTVLGNGGNVTTDLGMASHTSPAIAASPDGGFEVAFHGAGGSLWTYSPVGNSNGSNYNLGMATGTSPSIAALAGGSYQMAFQSNSGVLWTAGALFPNGCDYNLGMAAGTSPSIAASPTGGYRVAFQANSNVLWTAASDSVSDANDTNLGMAPGTSPSIAALITGEYVTSFQANTAALWILFSDGNFDGWSLNQQIAPSSGPIIAN